MASWKLGELFGVQEEKKGGNGSDEESGDEEEQRAAAFNKHKNNSFRVGGEGTSASQRSIRRYDEYGNFISRSERAHAEKAAGKNDWDHKLNQSLKDVSHRVQFKQPDEEMIQIKEVERMSGDDLERCFMTMANWEAIDVDIDITEMRWKNHVEGKIKFDDETNTIRGLEDTIFNLNKSRLIRKHQKTVMEEVVRQKTENEYLNWKKLCKVAENSSEVHIGQALRVGLQDEEEKDRVWNPRPNEAEAKSSTVSPTKGKRKSSIFGLFKKKK